MSLRNAIARTSISSRRRGAQAPLLFPRLIRFRRRRQFIQNDFSRLQLFSPRTVSNSLDFTRFPKDVAATGVLCSNAVEISPFSRFAILELKLHSSVTFADSFGTQQPVVTLHADYITDYKVVRSHPEKPYSLCSLHAYAKRDARSGSRPFQPRALFRL